MPFNTYADLQAIVADQLARSDLTTQIPDFIKLFEDEIRQELLEQLHNNVERLRWEW